MRINILLTQTHRKANKPSQSPHQIAIFLKQQIHHYRLYIPPPPKPLPVVHPSKSHSLHISYTFDRFTRVKSVDFAIFTDGSKHPHGTGCGSAVYQGSDLHTPVLELSTPLPKGTNIFTVEALAITEAVIHSIYSLIRQCGPPPGTSFHI